MKKKLLGLLLAITALFVLAACGNKGSDSGKQEADKIQTESGKKDETAKASGEKVKVVVGLTGTDSAVWNYIKEEAAKENIEIELKYFDSYNLPNQALNAGELDLNAFQHHFYLNKEVEELGYKIEAIADTVVAPLGIYSKQLKSLDELKDGSKVVIPDDATNGGRALILLESAGLIEIDDKAGKLPTIKDITSNPKNLQIVELAATNIPPSLDEVPIAVINSGVAVSAGIIPSQDAIVLEKYSEKENTYVNVIAARSAEKDRPEFKKIIEIYHTDAVKKIIEEDTKGSSIPVWK